MKTHKTKKLNREIRTVQDYSKNFSASRPGNPLETDPTNTTVTTVSVLQTLPGAGN